MPIAKVQLPDGRVAKFEVPEGTTPDQVTEFANAQFSGGGAPETATNRPAWLLGQSMPARAAKGFMEPPQAIAQILNHIAPPSYHQAIGLDKQEQFWNDENKSYEEQRKAAAGGGDPGWDLARGGGNMLSSMLMMRGLPGAGAGTMSRLGTGALGGGIAGALQPIYGNAPGDSFIGKKLLQMGAGSIFGAASNWGLGKLGDAITRQLSKFKAPAPGATDEIISKALDEIGQKMDDIAPDRMQALRGQVEEALKQGQKPDAAAMLRQQDFEALGMPSTLGQVTRDATQFAREKNLRGVAGVGEPLMQRFEQQDQMLGKMLGGFRGAGEDKTVAGENLVTALQAADKKMRGQVTAAYQAAEKSTGAKLDVPLKGLAQDYADVIDRFGTDNVPAAVRKKLDDLGLLSGKQMKTFSLLDADKLLKVINDNYNPAVAPEARALDVLRKAVKSAIDESDASGTPFEQAWSQARQRFQLHEAIPALEAASNKTINPDRIIDRYVINGNSNEVTGLAEILKATNPEAFKSARDQIGQRLERAAFGENVTGDKAISPERFARALREIGDTKLGAFFEPAEIEAMKRAARVGGYMHTTPSGAPVNTSNTAAAVMSLLGKVPGVPSSAALLGAAKNAISNKMTVDKAIAAQIPSKAADLTPEQIQLISKYLMGTSTAAGAFAGKDISQ